MAYGSRGPEGTLIGMGHWGYAGVILQGVYAGGGVSEEVRRRRKEEKEGGRKWDFHLKSNNPSLRGGEQLRSF